jgi:hypothetical protein
MSLTDFCIGVSFKYSMHFVNHIVNIGVTIIRFVFI